MSPMQPSNPHPGASLLLGLALASSLLLCGMSDFTARRGTAQNLMVRSATHSFRIALEMAVAESSTGFYPTQAAGAMTLAQRGLPNHQLNRFPWCAAPQSLPIPCPDAVATSGESLGELLTPTQAPASVRDWGAISYRAVVKGRSYLLCGTLAEDGQARSFVLTGD